jgi:hypothetical protein
MSKPPKCRTRTVISPARVISRSSPEARSVTDRRRSSVRGSGCALPCEPTSGTTSGITNHTVSPARCRSGPLRMLAIQDKTPIQAAFEVCWAVGMTSCE